MDNSGHERFSVSADHTYTSALAGLVAITISDQVGGAQTHCDGQTTNPATGSSKSAGTTQIFVYGGQANTQNTEFIYY